MSTHFIQSETMTGIADAVRNLRHEKGTMTPAQIEAKIRATTLGIPISTPNHMVNGHWVRPQGYPDLDSLTIASDFDGFYMTYDLTKTPGYGWIGLYCQIDSSSGEYYVERGHISEGEFVVDETHTQARNTYFRQTLDDTYGDVQLWRVRAKGRLLRYGFCPSTASTSTAIINQGQPCVEFVGRLNYVNNFVSTSLSNSVISQSTIWLERYKLESSGLKNVTQFNNTWRAAFSLQSLEIEDLPVDKWSVTSFINVFHNCHSLVSLDLSKWDVSNWNVPSLASVWNGCYSLKTLKISNWDVSNWSVSSLASTWQDCNSLEELDLSTWDVSGWPMTNLSYTWYNCCALHVLGISTWDTSDWTITTGLVSVWNNCNSLQELDLSHWDTSKWTVTSLNYTWFRCYSLKTLDISTWDTSGWAVTNIESAWQACFSLLELDLSDWVTSNWAVTYMNYCWYQCFALRTLDISTWDVSDWRPTELISVWNSCMCLETLDLTDWETGDWPMDHIEYLFFRCWGLRELDLSDWDTTSWSITPNIVDMIDETSILETLGYPTGIVYAANNTPNFRMLRVFNGMPTDANHSYSSAYSLTPQSLVNILTALPTIGTSKTITLGNNQRKLTSAQIAVATQKGWTVA